MQERIKEVAARIKELRDILEISADDMAVNLRISPEKYLNYENGEEDIPASILYEISHKLGVEMSILLTGETPRMHYFSVTRKGQGVSVERRKQYKYQSLASNFINKKAEPFVVTVEPKPAKYGSADQHASRAGVQLCPGRQPQAHHQRSRDHAGRGRFDLFRLEL